MSAMLRELCVLSVLSGALLALCPEGSVKKAAETVAAAVLAGVLLGIAAEIDFEAYAARADKSRGSESEISDRYEKANDELNKLVIEEKCRAYIIDKARAAGIEEFEAELELYRGVDGKWLPWSARIKCSEDEVITEAVKQDIRNELGIPYERQSWSR